MRDQSGTVVCSALTLLVILGFAPPVVMGQQAPAAARSREAVDVEAAERLRAAEAAVRRQVAEPGEVRSVVFEPFTMGDGRGPASKTIRGSFRGEVEVTEALFKLNDSLQYDADQAGGVPRTDVVSLTAAKGTRLAVEGKVEGRRAVGKYLFAVVDSAVFRILSPREGPGPRGQEDRFSHAARLASYQNAVVNGSAEHKAVVERIKSLTEAATRRLRERMAAERAAEFTAVVAELARATGDRVIVVKHWQ